MPTITQTANADGVWDGTIPADASATGITHYELYAAAVDEKSSYKRVKRYTNPGVGTVTLGPLTYAQLFLINPTKKFFLRAVAVRGGKVDDVMSVSSPALPVAPSTFTGWTLAQLQEMDIRPCILVGYDPTNKLFYPINVTPAAGGGFQLKVDSA